MEVCETVPELRNHMADDDLESCSELAQNRTLKDENKHISGTGLPKNEKLSNRSECLSTETGYKTCRYEKTDDTRIGAERRQKNYV